MSTEKDHSNRPIRPGHSGRLRDAEGMRATQFILGMVLVFVLTMMHDEIAHYLVDRGWIAESIRELAEIGIGVVLFAIWSGLMIGLLRVVNAAGTGQK